MKLFICYSAIAGGFIIGALRVHPIAGGILLAIIAGLLTAALKEKP